MWREHEERMICEIVERVDADVAKMLVHLRREILVAVGTSQAVIDRLVAVADQAVQELVALRAEIDGLQTQGVDVSAAAAKADQLEATINTVKDQAAEIPVTGDAESQADAAALTAVPQGSTVTSVTKHDDETIKVHVTFPDGELAVVHLAADYTIVNVTQEDGSPEPAPAPGTGDQTGSNDTGSTDTGTPPPDGGTPVTTTPQPAPGEPGDSNPAPVDGSTPPPTPPDAPVGGADGPMGPTGEAPGNAGDSNPGTPVTEPAPGTVAGGEVQQPDGTETPAAGEVPGSTVVTPPDNGPTPVP